jgi:cytoskeletal protein CcmA (bactofilin family)
LNLGKVIGDIKAESLAICNTAIIHGNITCKSLECAPDAMLIGNLNIDPFSNDFPVHEIDDEEEQGDEE